MLFWYTNQTFCVQWAGLLSDRFTATNGVNQGGILSPQLFNVFMNELSVELSKSGYGCKVITAIVNHFLYADDLTLLSPSVKGLQKLIDICSKYAKKNFIIFNDKKTKCMYIKSNKSLKVSVEPKLYLNGCKLDVTESHRYLGFIVSNVNDNLDINRQLRSFITKTNMLVRNFFKCSFDVKLTLFNSFCANMYCIHMWSSFHKTLYNRFKIVYNNGFRKFIGLPKFCSASGMFAYSRTFSLQEVMRKTIFNFINRVNKSSNTILMQFVNPYFVLKSKQWQYWYSCLYGR